MTGFEPATSRVVVASGGRTHDAGALPEARYGVIEWSLSFIPNQGSNVRLSLTETQNTERSTRFNVAIPVDVRF